MIHIGGDTDPYQPIERSLGITRDIIQVLSAFQHPFSIISKSNLILRDLDLYATLAERSLVTTAISITTLEPVLARRMEPRAPTPARRLDAVAGLARAGVPVTVMFAPVIPGLNDHELEAVFAAAAAAGAQAASYVVLRLPREITQLFSEWLKTDYPDRAAHVLSLIRQMRAGQLYQTGFGERMRGKGPIAQLIARRAQLARKRYGLDKPAPLLTLDAFRRPLDAGDQLPLL